MSLPLHVHTIVNSWFGENTFVVWAHGSSEALVIDPGIDIGMEPDSLLGFLQEQGLRLVGLLNTHGHADHIGGNAALKLAFPEAPLIIGANEARMLLDPQANLSAPFGFPITSPPADRTVKEGDVLELAGIRLEVLDIPGHSPGHVVFVHEANPTLIFGGDVLFRSGVGRYDFPGGDGALLFRGIQTKMYHLPDTAVVYPGHGPTTTIGHEKRTNPFVQAEESEPPPSR